MLILRATHPVFFPDFAVDPSDLASLAEHGPTQETVTTRNVLKESIRGMKPFRILFMGAVILSALTVAFGSSVKSDYQKDFDFSRLRTFNFKTDRTSNDPLVTNAIEANRIQNALSAQLQMNGFTQSQDNPDFIVAFYSRTRERTQVQSFGYGPGFGWGYRVPFRNRWRWGFGPG